MKENLQKYRETPIGSTASAIAKEKLLETIEEEKIFAFRSKDNIG
ncbi:hypothetical protein AAEU33_20380 [Chryseobacterium sp. Chry.R1]